MHLCSICLKICSTNRKITKFFGKNELEYVKKSLQHSQAWKFKAMEILSHLNSFLFITKKNFQEPKIPCNHEWDFKNPMHVNIQISLMKNPINEMEIILEFLKKNEFL